MSRPFSFAVRTLAATAVVCVLTFPLSSEAEKPADTNPAVTNPAVTNPAVTNPANTSPADTTPEKTAQQERAAVEERAGAIIQDCGEKIWQYNDKARTDPRRPPFMNIRDLAKNVVWNTGNDPRVQHAAIIALLDAARTSSDANNLTTLSEVCSGVWRMIDFLPPQERAQFPAWALEVVHGYPIGTARLQLANYDTISYGAQLNPFDARQFGVSQFSFTFIAKCFVKLDGPPIADYQYNAGTPGGKSQGPFIVLPELMFETDDLHIDPFATLGPPSGPTDIRYVKMNVAVTVTDTAHSQTVHIPYIMRLDPIEGSTTAAYSRPLQLSLDGSPLNAAVTTAQSAIRASRPRHRFLAPAPPKPDVNVS